MEKNSLNSIPAKEPYVNDAPEEKDEWWKHRLFDSEGSKETNELARKFWSEIKAEIPEVLYFSIVGSTVKGYANVDSDVDAYLVINEKWGEKAEDLTKMIFQFLNAFKLKQETPIKIDLHVDNLEYIDEPDRNRRHAVALLNPTLGEGDLCRERIKDSLRKLDYAEKERWIDTIVGDAMHEQNGLKVMRRELVSREDLKAYFELRKKLIYERVERFYFDRSDEK